MVEPVALVRRALQEIRAGYWFIPAALSVGAVALAAATWWIEARLPTDLPLYDFRVEGARNLLTTIASAVLGVTGVMFSLTLVAVSHAAGKYGPRLIGNFMRDRGAQWSLGILVGVFAYAMTTLVLTDGLDERALRLPVLVAVALVAAALGTIIYYIHHVPETMNVSNIAAGLGRRLRRMIREQIDGAEARGRDAPWELPARAPDVVVPAPEVGYVQAVGFERLIDWAEEGGLHLHLHATPGDFVHPRRPLLSVWGAADAEAAGEVLAKAVALGPEPTETQTLTFLADQLVEMTGIALSPGVNDPFTAMTCLDWLSAALAEAICHEGGLRPLHRPRLVARELDFAELYAHTFPTAMPYVLGDPVATRRAIELLEGLVALPGAADRRAMLADLRKLRRSQRNS